MIEDADTGELVTYDKVFEDAINGVAAMASEEWMENHAEDALLRWARNGQPVYWQDEPALSAYMAALLKGLETTDAGTDAWFKICDRIERVINGDD